MKVPKRGRGRPKAAAAEQHEAQIRALIALMIQLSDAVPEEDPATIKYN